MKVIHYLVIGLFLSGGGVMLLQYTRIIRQPTAEEKQRIKFEGLVQERYRADIDRVKAKGGSEIKIVSEVLPSSITTLEQITSKYSLVRVRVKDKEVSVNPNGSIQTWYKVDLLGFEHKQDEIGEGTLPDNVPSRFLPLLPSESLLSEGCGTITVDGIRIESVVTRDKFVLDPQGEYLIAAYLDCEGKLIRQVAQSAGVFQIEYTTLKPLGQRHLELVREVDQKYGNDLARFRTDIQSRQMREK